jgi:branched-chain amino acid transport system permease protein
LDTIGGFRHHGGSGRHAFVLGALIGAAIFVVLQDYLSSQTENWMSFVGLFLVLVVLFFPRGILGAIRRKAAS